MRRTLTCLLIVTLSTVPSQAQRRRATQDPQVQAQRRAAQQQRAAQRAEQQTNQASLQASTGQDKNRRITLLPPPETLTDGDAYPLYEQAGKLLPSDAIKQMGPGLTSVKPGQLPLDQVRQVLQQCQPAMDMVEKASLCRFCKWPAAASGAQSGLVVSPQGEWAIYRDLCKLVYAKGSLAIAENRPADAVKTFQTSLAMARHLGTGPGLWLPNLGLLAVNRLTCLGIPAYAELSGAPNLYDALAALPRPSIDVEKAFQAEIDGANTNPQISDANRPGYLEQLKIGLTNTRQLAKRMDRDVAALQCMEAIRQYALDHNGALPQTLDEIKVSIPQDVLNAKPFEYTCTGTQAVLRSPRPEGEKAKIGLRFEISASKADQGVRFAVNRVEE
jgi:type II secretory pathway pseudopilin PulG